MANLHTFVWGTKLTSIVNEHSTTKFTVSHKLRLGAINVVKSDGCFINKLRILVTNEGVFHFHRFSTGDFVFLKRLRIEFLANTLHIRTSKGISVTANIDR